ncbi:MAG TPA: PAS domain S-box protein [Puia sp.]|nr:PAS domain S-box protein [Puia sp.]
MKDVLNSSAFILSDLLIWLAFMAIPFIIIRFIKRQPEIRFARLYYLFASFILACGVTYLLDALTYWFPIQPLSALLRAITAIISWIAVFYLIRQLPYADRALKARESLEFEVKAFKEAASSQQVKNILAQESRQLFKNVFDHSPVGIALVSPEGRWLNVNQSICEMLGYGKDELLKSSFQAITHPDDLAVDMAFVGQMLNKERETYQMEKRYIRKDGSYMWALLSVSLTWQEGRPAFFISQLTDITLRKSLQMEVEQKNTELENHLIRINEFNRIVAHNLRGPASSLINMSDYLEKSRSEADRDFLLSRVKDTSLLIINTLNDLTQLLEIQLRHEQQSAVCLFRDAYEHSLHMLGEEYKTASPVIDVKFEVKEVLFPKAYLDSIFYNLLSNAIKYRRKDKTPVIFIGTTVMNGHVVLTVKDNGIGIDMQKHGDDIFKYKKVFHKGYHSNGVGLFLTRSQVEASNGKIEVESAVSEGTVFRVYLPKNHIL